MGSLKFGPAAIWQVYFFLKVAAVTDLLIFKSLCFEDFCQ